jgi:predicted DNA-binding antitoxin AbrB/MazE fold protein
VGQKITATVENGVLRPSAPLGLPEGERFELEVVRPLSLDAEAEARVRRLDEAFDAFWEEAAKYPQEWWDDYERDLRANRMNFEERA